MKKLLCLLLLFSAVSCIPYKFAPRIEDYSISNARKFKRDLPNEFAFVFEDEKDANEFYHFVNTKFQLDFEDVETNVPLYLEGEVYFMSFHEREKTTEAVSLVPLLIDGILQNQDYGPLLEGAYSTHQSHWYILLTVLDEDFNDCLHPNYIHREDVIDLLRQLKEEYQGTHHYMEAVFKVE